MKTSMYTGVKTILLVDHEDYLSTFLSKLLEKKGYKVITAENLEQAVSTYKDRQSQIDLILMDISKETDCGLTAFNCLKKNDPETLVLLTSIYSQEQLGGLENLPFIRKPMIPSELFQTLNTMFCEYAAATKQSRKI